MNAPAGKRVSAHMPLLLCALLAIALPPARLADSPDGGTDKKKKKKGTGDESSEEELAFCLAPAAPTA